MVSRPIIFDEHDTQAARNKRSRDKGVEFESLIETACEYYSLRRYAKIEKTPEPRRVIGRTGGRKSQMICVNEKKAQPDFKGTIAGGRSVVFEAKRTDGDRMPQSYVTETQAENLDEHEKLGALCFVLVSFGMREFFRVPWHDWKCMKELYGRKYIKPEDAEKFRIGEAGGILLFLE